MHSGNETSNMKVSIVATQFSPHPPLTANINILSGPWAMGPRPVTGTLVLENPPLALLLHFIQLLYTVSISACVNSDTS